MKNIVLYAPPAAGKGTLCESLKLKGYEVISIGEVLRNARTPDTEIGRTIIEAQDKGMLVPDDIVKEALKEELNRIGDKPIVIEGYPRNIAQAKLLDTVLKNYIVINLAIDKELAKDRTLSRITCSKCGKIYNTKVEEMMPPKNGICPICGNELMSRSDDNEKSFDVRFSVYEENSKEILKFYENKNCLYIVDSSKDKEYTLMQVLKIMGDLND